MPKSFIVTVILSILIVIYIFWPRPAPNFSKAGDGASTWATGKVTSITEVNGEIKLGVEELIGAYITLPLTAKGQFEVGKKYTIYFSEPIGLHVSADNFRFLPTMEIVEVK